MDPVRQAEWDATVQRLRAKYAPEYQNPTRGIITRMEEAEARFNAHLGTAQTVVRLRDTCKAQAMHECVTTRNPWYYMLSMAICYMDENPTGLITIEAFHACLNYCKDNHSVFQWNPLTPTPGQFVNIVGRFFDPAARAQFTAIPLPPTIRHELDVMMAFTLLALSVYDQCEQDKDVLHCTEKNFIALHQRIEKGFSLHMKSMNVGDIQVRDVRQRTSRIWTNTLAPLRLIMA